MFNIENYLKKTGGCLSSVLTDKIASSGTTRDAAKQRISRAISKGSIKRLYGLSFPKKASFIYHESSFTTDKYWGSLIATIFEFSPAYGAAIRALQTRGGVVPLRYFPIISGSPIKQKKQISSNVVLERLTGIQIIRTVEVEGIGPCVIFDALGHIPIISPAELKARLFVENILLLAVKDWARKLGIASYNSVQLRDDKKDLPSVGTFNWDICGPSYLRPFWHYKDNGKLEGGFFVCDVVAGEALNLGAVEAFVRKCKMNSAHRKLSSVMPILIAEGYTPEAFNLARKEGIVAATITNLFGKETAEGLSSLLLAMTKMAEMAVHRPEIIDEVFGKLGHIEGAAGNLRGALFEMLVGHCVKKLDDGSIDIGKRVNDNQAGKQYEIDVFRVKEHREVWIYECKAHQPTEVIELEDVKHWRKERVAPIYKILREEARFHDCKFHFEYWTCGTFSKDAEEYLSKHAEKTKKYRIGYKDGIAVRNYIKRIRPKSVLEMFDQHFYKHPLAKIEKTFLVPSRRPESLPNQEPLKLEQQDN